jgi:hypothetical protein
LELNESHPAWGGFFADCSRWKGGYGLVLPLGLSLPLRLELCQYQYQCQWQCLDLLGWPALGL